MSWSDLPADLIAAIAGRLTDHSDLANFRSVCPSWRSSSATRLRVPRLFLPNEYGGTSDSRRVWYLTGDRLGKIPFPAARGRPFLFASHYGWMLAVDGDLSATLVYPFMGVDPACLPTLPSSSGGDSEKVLHDLAWDWSPHGVVVSPGNGDGAFFCRPGDASWRLIGCPTTGISSVTYCDAAFYLFDGKTCKVTVVDAATVAVTAVIEPPAVELPRWDFEANLVVSPGELFLFVRKLLLHPGCTGSAKYFKAFRADGAATGDRIPSWSEIAGIGDRAVFVDHFRAFFVEANAFNGLRRNCMYVASSYDEVYGDYSDYVMETVRKYSVAVLNIDDLETKDLSFGNLYKLACHGFWLWPSWALPNLR